MTSIGSMRGLEDFGRVRLSKSFYMRDFLYSEIANFYGMPNVPDDPDLAIAAGKALCENLLQPLSDTFGGIAIRSAFRSGSINRFGNENDLSCATNEKNYGRHIWDRRDTAGNMGATACIVVPWFTDRYDRGDDWRALAWWIHDHLPYSHMFFYPNLCAFNITWCEVSDRRIDSRIEPVGCLTKPGMDNHDGDHSDAYPGFPTLTR